MISVEIRQGIYRDRFDKDIVIKSILDILSKETESLVFLILEDQIRYLVLLSYSNIPNLKILRS